MDEAVARGLASLVAPGGVLELLLAPAPRDGLDAVPATPAGVIDAACGTFGALGLEAVVAREATATEIAATGSTWAKRLGVAGRRNGANRTAIRIRLVRR